MEFPDLKKIHPGWIVLVALAAVTAVLTLNGPAPTQTMNVPVSQSDVDKAQSRDIQSINLRVGSLSDDVSNLKSRLQQTRQENNTWALGALYDTMEKSYIANFTHRGPTETTFLRYTEASFLSSFSIPNQILDTYSDWSIIPDSTAEEMVFAFGKPLPSVPKWPPSIAKNDRTFRITSRNIFPKDWPLADCLGNPSDDIRRIAAKFQELESNKESDPCSLVAVVGSFGPNDSAPAYTVYRFGHAPSNGIIPLLVIPTPWKPEDGVEQFYSYVHLSLFGDWPNNDPTKEEQDAWAKELETIVLPFSKSLGLGLCEYACAY